MMNGGNPILFSRGIEISNINGNINKKEYNAMYDGNKGKMILNDNNKIYHIEVDDIQKIFDKPKSNIGIEQKLKNLVDIPRKKKTIKIQTPSRKKNKTHYTIKKKLHSSKRKHKTSKKRKTPSRKKRKTPSKKKRKKKKRKTPSKNKTKQRLLPDDLLKTII